MSEDQFTKLFKYMQKEFTHVNGRFDKQDEKIDDLTGAVAELGGQLKDYHQELVMLARKVDRLERWINQIAQQTGVKLEY
jgi:chromosome segregation ATPase